MWLERAVEAARTEAANRPRTKPAPAAITTLTSIADMPDVQPMPPVATVVAPTVAAASQLAQKAKTKVSAPSAAVTSSRVPAAASTATTEARLQRQKETAAKVAALLKGDASTAEVAPVLDDAAPLESDAITAATATSAPVTPSPAVAPPPLSVVASVSPPRLAQLKEPRAQPVARATPVRAPTSTPKKTPSSSSSSSSAAATKLTPSTPTMSPAEIAAKVAALLEGRPMLESSPTPTPTPDVSQQINSEDVADSATPEEIDAIDATPQPLPAVAVSAAAPLASNPPPIKRSHMHPNDLRTALSSLAGRFDAAGANRVVAEYERLGGKLGIASLTAWLDCFKRSNDWLGAERVWTRMQQLQPRPLVGTYRALMQVYMRTGDPAQVAKIDPLYEQMLQLCHKRMLASDFKQLIKMALQCDLPEQVRKWADRALAAGLQLDEETMLRVEEARQMEADNAAKIAAAAAAAAPTPTAKPIAATSAPSLAVSTVERAQAKPERTPVLKPA